ncbi:hypothetical protein CPB84DRAFT_1778363 [Gymnopilus junonius]|uniref:CST complex subunit STN1 n=1 Tax=Gymnopilus junonius TaxID=109634 RepID=A0A9P5NR07_GYMJU|nr:hypothetical protein CPB84DRAFT_1778363 [Gymnopilus junonius]
MQQNTVETRDLFWLGPVPCSSVKIVGMIVGIRVYEKKIIYTVDDGTGVIDCNHSQPRAAFFGNTGNINSSLSKYQRIEPQLPKPICRIGSFVRLTGRLLVCADSRQISVKDIELCSANNELMHTRAVRELHRSSYSSTEPFTIPSQPAFSTPKKVNVLASPSTINSSRPSSTSSSPIKPEKQSPIKLRHPSRLHTHDLTENTFRIYLKHYMDHAPVIQGPTNADYDSDTGIGNAIDRLPETPTKRSRYDETPRQQSSRLAFDATPRSRIPAPNFSATTSSSFQQGSSETPDSIRRGFSLSYLRRIPELSLLASRVVEAVGRRKLREERRKLKEAGFQPSHNQKVKMLSAPVISPGKFAGKKKRLFKWAVVELLKEGCIVLWDGPVRPCPNIRAIKDTSKLWKANITASTTLEGDNTLFSMSSGTVPSFLLEGEDGDAALSDPDPNEEAYISLTADYLADFVESAIKVLVRHYEDAGKPYSGASKESILSILKKDDRWQHVGEWNVDDTLKFLQAEGRVWAVGKNGWDVTE